MKNVEFADRLSNVWQKSRSQAGRSQDYVARALGVSKKTVQNWESGLGSPSFRTAIEWFEVLGIPMYPYLMRLLYPKEMDNLSVTSNEEDIRTALHKHIDQLDDFHIRELLYLLSGEHGSSPTGTLDVMTAYLHLPLYNRVIHTQNLLNQYDLACELGYIEAEEHALPDRETMLRYVKTAKTAVLKGNKSYTIMEE